MTENSTISGTDNAAMIYDALNRLTSKSDKDTSGAALASYAYAYDADGNITFGKSAQQTAAMTYDTLDRLSAYNGSKPAFGLDGNLTSCTLGGSVVSFVYDSGNRLTQAGTATYTYDANDNRTASAAGGKKTQYAYENAAAKLSQLLVRTNPDGSQTFYVYGLGLIGQQDSTGYSVYHFDFRGSTVALTNSSGAVTDRFTYGAYGELLAHTGSSNTPFMYNGRDGVLTDANGLYYMRARYYSPELKRFLNTDSKKGSIDKSKSLNIYSYVTDNPVLLVDPNGQFPTIVIGAIIGLAIGAGTDLVNQGIQNNWNWSKMNWKEIGINAATGAASGALAGTGADLPLVIAVNALLSGMSYAGIQLADSDAVDPLKLAFSTAAGGVAGGIGGPGILHGETGEMIGRWTQSGLLAKYLNESAGKIIVNGDEIAKEVIRDMLKKAATPSIIRTIFGGAISATANDIFDKHEKALK